jgi:hypothetical protein
LSIGKSGAALVAIIAINVTTLIGLAVSVFVFKSVLAIALFSLVATLVSLICWLSFANYHLGYKLKMQLQDFLPALAAGAVMFATVLLAGKLPVPEVLLMVLQVLVGVVVYIAISVVCKMKAFGYVLGILKRKR